MTSYCMITLMESNQESMTRACIDLLPKLLDQGIPVVCLCVGFSLCAHSLSIVTFRTLTFTLGEIHQPCVLLSLFAPPLS